MGGQACVVVDVGVGEEQGPNLADAVRGVGRIVVVAKGG